MSYHLLLSPNRATMTVISDTDLEYPIFVHLGYIELTAGTKRQCQEELERIDPQAPFITHQIN